MDEGKRVGEGGAGEVITKIFWALPIPSRTGCFNSILLGLVSREKWMHCRGFSGFHIVGHSYPS